MSTMIYGQAFVPIVIECAAEMRAEPELAAMMYEAARKHARNYAEHWGGELLPGPARLVHFHEASSMPSMFVFPTVVLGGER